MTLAVSSCQFLAPPVVRYLVRDLPKSAQNIRRLGVESLAQRLLNSVPLRSLSIKQCSWD